MASTQDPEPLLVNGASLHVVNGVNGVRPASPPSVGNLALTEYSAKPSPPSEDATTSMKNIVPDEFLLPNGHPDVSLVHQTSLPLGFTRVIFLLSMASSARASSCCVTHRSSLLSWFVRDLY